MQPRRKLEMDSLAVDSFETLAEDSGARGTVEAQGAECTAPATCKCATSLYRCGTIRATAFSCPPTLVCA